MFPLSPQRIRAGFWLRLAIVVLATLLVVTTASAAPVAQEFTPGDFLQLVLAWFTAVVPYLSWLLALILADFLLGVAVAAKTRTFDWAKLADFYASNVLPKLLGYIVINALLYVSELLPAGIVPDGFIPVSAAAAFGVIVASLIGSIVGHIMALGFTETETAVGFHNTVSQ